MALRRGPPLYDATPSRSLVLDWGTRLFASIFFWIGGAFGFDGWYLAAPMVVLAWIPLAARYALWKLV